MYSTEIRKMMKFVRHIDDINLLSKTHLKEMNFTQGSTKFYWDGYGLAIMFDNTKVTIHPGLYDKRHESHRNFISFFASRMNIQYNSIDFRTRTGENLYVQTKDLAYNEAVHFQTSLIVDIPEQEVIADLYDISKELIENDVTYFGHYNLPTTNMHLVIRTLEDKYPETKGLWNYDAPNRG